MAMDLHPDHQHGTDPEAPKRGRAAIAMGPAEDAVRLCRIEVERDPSSGRAWHSLGVALYRTGAFEEALDALQRAAERMPRSAETLYAMGVIRKDQRVHDDAQVLFSRVLDLEPEHAHALYNRGICRFSAGDGAGAVDDFTQACALAPDWTDAAYNLVIALAATRQYQRADQVLREREDLGPSQRADLYCDLGAARADDPECSDDVALAYFRRALELDPDFVQAQYRMGLVHARAKNRGPEHRQAAIDQLRELAARRDLRLEFPDAYRVYFALGSCLDDVDGNLDEAAEAYGRCVELAPRYAPALNNLGVVLRRKGDRARAMVMFRRAVLVSPGYAHAYHNLCSCYYDSSPDDLAEHLTDLLREAEAQGRCVQVVAQLVPRLVDLAKSDAFAAVYDQMHATKNVLGVACSRARGLLRREWTDAAVQREVSDLQELQSQAYDALVDFLRVLRPADAEPEVVDLNEVARRAVLHVQAMGPLFEHIRLVPASVVPRIQGKPRRLREMIVNLLLNAAQATGSGEGPGRIDVIVEVSPPRLLGGGYAHVARVTVRDTGPGMSEEDLGNALKPGFTTRPGGSGFGLPIAEHVVREHLGALAIDSAAGRGTTVTVELPPHADLQPNGTRMSLRPVIFEDYRDMLQTEVDDAPASDTHEPEMRQ